MEGAPQSLQGGCAALGSGGHELGGRQMVVEQACSS